MNQVQSINIGKNSVVWQYSIVLKEAIIGDNCNINSHCFIENDVIIGNNVTVKCGVYIWDGTRISDNVFIGPNVTFTNDKYPRSKKYPGHFEKTILEEGVSIGAGSTILCGLTIGKYAMIGAASLVTKNIPPFTLWYGSPAIHKGYVTLQGEVLGLNLIGKDNKEYQYINGNILLK